MCIQKYDYISAGKSGKTKRMARFRNICTGSVGWESTHPHTQTHTCTHTASCELYHTQVSFASFMAERLLCIFSARVCIRNHVGRQCCMSLKHLKSKFRPQEKCKMFYQDDSYQRGGNNRLKQHHTAKQLRLE